MADRTVVLSQNGRHAVRGLSVNNPSEFSAYQDDDDDLTYVVDLSAYLDGATITVVTRVPQGVFISNSSNTTTRLTQRLRGFGYVDFKVQTSAGDVEEFRINILRRTGSKVVLGASGGGGTAVIDGNYGDVVVSGNGTVWTVTGGGGGGVSDGDKGDIVVSGSGTVWSIDAGAVVTADIANDAVTYAKMQNVSATDRLLGRSTAGAGDVEEIVCTAAGRALIDDATTLAQQQTLGAFDTVAAVNAATIDSTVNHCRTAGYYANGDGGGALYKRVASGAAGAGTPRITSNSGAVIWELAAEGVLNVQQFGAYNDGTNAATTTSAFQAAAAFTKTVYVPRGTFNINGTVVISLNGSFWFGAGQDNSTITSSSTTAPMFTINAGLNGVQFRDLFLTRSVAATSGADGIRSLNATIGQATLEYLRISNQWNGLTLGPTDWSKVSHVLCENNYNVGIYVGNSASNGVCQWYFQNCLSQKNNAQGYFLQSAAGPANMLCGTFDNCATFANTGVGFAAIGSASVPLQSVRIDGGFFGESGNSEIYLDTYGDQHTIENCFVELTGTVTTGRNTATPASNIGHGVEITANNTGVLLAGLHINGCSQNGIRTSATATTIAATRVNNCGAQLASGQRAGAYVVAGRANFVGGWYGNRSGALQQYGIRAADGANISIVGADLTNNATASLLFDANANSATVVASLPNTINTQLPIVETNAGSATAPTVTTKGDTNTGIFYPAADVIGFTTGGTNRMRVLSNGFVAIGAVNSAPTSTGITNDFLAINTNGMGIGSIGDLTNVLGFATSNTERMRIDSTGNVGINATSGLSTLRVGGSFAAQAPQTTTAATYTVAATDYSVRFNGTAACTVTMPSAASFPGRILIFNAITAFAVTSAASNIVPLNSTTAGTAILAATGGRYATLQSDGTNWIILEGN